MHGKRRTSESYRRTVKLLGDISCNEGEKQTSETARAVNFMKESYLKTRKIGAGCASLALTYYI
jgi:hypothetical protein